MGKVICERNGEEITERESCVSVGLWNILCMKCAIEVTDDGDC
jgi:hypothetical protein